VSRPHARSRVGLSYASERQAPVHAAPSQMPTPPLSFEEYGRIHGRPPMMPLERYVRDRQAAWRPVFWPNRQAAWRPVFWPILLTVVFFFMVLVALALRLGSLS
jgi:preprotein translocase subunit SecE